MALKDLITERGKIAEEMIEGIVADYVRYELKPNEIVLTPKGAALNNDAKILVYLVAVLGWQYVAEEEHSVRTKPAELEAVLGIPGGTLRPILKKLKDTYLLNVVDGQYSIRPSNLDAVSRAVRGEKTVLSTKRAPKKSMEKLAVEPEVQQSLSDESNVRRKSGVPIRSSLTALIEDGFFSEFRTLTQIIQRFHEQAIIAKQTSLSGPIAEFVRHKKLIRMKVDEGRKQVWAYKVA